MKFTTRWHGHAVLQRIYIRWWRQLFSFEIMFIYPPIEQLGGRLLCEQRYYDAFLNDEKHIEINLLRTKKCVAPPPEPYSHFLFHRSKSVTKGKKVPNLVGINLGCFGPFRTAFDAWNAAKERNLKLGMSLEELEQFMTRLRLDRETREMRTEVIPVMLHIVGGVHETNEVEWIHGDGNQAGFRRHYFQPKGTISVLDRVCLFRYRDVGGNRAAAAAPDSTPDNTPAVAMPRIVICRTRVCAPGAASEVECGTGGPVGFWCPRGRGTRRIVRHTGFNGLRRLGYQHGSTRSSICRSRLLLPAIPRKQRARNEHL
jgi:hypothetical protein